MKTLSKLTKIDLREVWQHEALDFTKWLAQEDNLNALGSEIGVDIKLIQTEASVGKFNVDILAEDETSGRKVIIENQLEDTDHDHLGKIITYASGYDAEVIVWVVKDTREEHKRAVEWLNEHTDEEIGFFLIKIEVYQIDGSNPAPKFEIIVQPNEWAKTIKTSSSNGELTNTKLQQLQFWDDYKNYVRKEDTQMRLQTPRPQHWYNVSAGTSEAHIALTVNTTKNLLGCEIYITRNKDLYNFMHQFQAEIEKEIGESAEWIDASVASRIVITKKVAGIFIESEAETYFDWLYKKTVLLQKILGNYYRQFKER